MLENFIYAKEKSLFEEALSNGNVLDEAIVFIEDTKEIWNHGTYFDGSTFDPSNLENYVTEEELEAKGYITAAQVPNPDLSSYITKEDAHNYTDTAIANLVDSAPETLNTLNELATAISEHLNVTNALDAAISNKADKTEIPTKVSLLENDVLYALKSDVEVEVEVEVADGVYAVTADNLLIDYNIADSSCIGVALITDNLHIMIEKMGEANTDIIKAAYDADGASNTKYKFFYWGMYNSDVAGITNISSPDEAKQEFNGKANTAAIIAAPDTDSNTSYANMGTYCTKFNEMSGVYSDWYIPAAGQLYEIHNNLTDINAALEKIGGTKLDATRYYWSSSEFGAKYAWCVYFDRGDVGYYSKNNFGYLVRFIRDLSTTTKKPLKEKVSELESVISNLILKINALEEQIATGGGGGNSEEVIETVNTYKTELESQIGDMSSIMNEINEDTELSEASLILDEING